MLQLAVGEQWTGQLPPPERSFINLRPGPALTLVMNYPKPTMQELAAFRQSTFCCYVIDIFPAILWIIDFPLPIGEVAAVFNAKDAPSKRCEAFLREEGEGKGTLFHMVLLDGTTVAASRIITLNPYTAQCFFALATLQLNGIFTDEQFQDALESFMLRNSFTEMKEKAKGCICW